MICIDDIYQAQRRISQYVHRTPVMESHLLNEWLGHRILFKTECLQRIGAFKIRGAVNAIARMQEENRLPQHIVANSSGNHAQAVALAAKLFGIRATIFGGNNISTIKAAATRAYGAELRLFDSRIEADEAVQQAALQPDIQWLPPFNHVDIMAGQGTAVVEALEDCDPVDAVAVPCGGGGLLSGSYVAAKAKNPAIQVIAAEPLSSNDAAESRRKGEIVRFSGAPTTLADGAATPSVGDLTFPFVKMAEGFYEVSELAIQYWTQWLQHLLKLHVEPTCAMTMQAVVDWLNDTQPEQPQTILVVISGGNIAADKMAAIWQKDFLSQVPGLHLDL
ncbi:MAG: serine/threonine dehydratase [Aestuariibacter sp.]